MLFLYLMINSIVIIPFYFSKFYVEENGLNTFLLYKQMILISRIMKREFYVYICRHCILDNTQNKQTNIILCRLFPILSPFLSKIQQQKTLPSLDMADPK